MPVQHGQSDPEGPPRGANRKGEAKGFKSGSRYVYQKFLIVLTAIPCMLGRQTTDLDESCYSHIHTFCFDHAGQSRKADRKGKTLAEIEDEEGGPVKESMIGMAHINRAAKRKGEISDAKLLENVEQAEEELQVEEEDGIQFEAFNLIEERRRGHFDEAGNYVEREDKEEKEAVDAWLASEEGKLGLNINCNLYIYYTYIFFYIFLWSTHILFDH